MSSRFEEVPDSPLLLTPELAERVVERFAERRAERERAEVAERERLANMTRVHELADLLGTTPEEIREIAQEESKRLPPTPKPVEVRPEPPETKPRWPIHTAYLVTLALIALLWPPFAARSYLDTRPPHKRLELPPGFTAAVMGHRFDPYVDGTVRSTGLNAPWETNHEYLVHPSILPPPPGFALKLIYPGGDRIVTGPPGRVKDDAATVEALQKSIRSLVAYEESLATIEGDVPIVRYDRAPWMPQDASYQGRPDFVGWHDVEVSDGVHTHQGLVPDRRYAKDLAAYSKAMTQRLNDLTDTKFFPGQPPANLRPGSVRVAMPTLPKGTSFMVWNGKRTIWAQGSATKADPTAVGEGFTSLIEEATRRLADSMGPVEDHLQITLVYPGGEYYNNWPLDGAKAYPPGGQQTRQADEIKSLVASAIYAVAPPSRPKGTIRYGPPATPARPVP